MVVEGQVSFPASREVVWELLLDPAVIARTIPGTTRMVRAADGRYEGKMGVRLGPLVAAEFDLVVTLADVVAPERYTMRIDGRGRLGFARGTTRVVLTADGPGTLVRYSSDLAVGGTISLVGQRLLEAVGARLARQGLGAMRAEVIRRLGGAPSPPAAGRS